MLCFCGLTHNHNTEGDKLPFNGQAGAGSHTSMDIKAADTNEFL